MWHLIGEAAEWVFAKGAEKAAAELGERLLVDWDAQRQASVGGPPRQLVDSRDSVEVCAAGKMLCL